MTLTPRDTEMLRLVARHRFLRSTHLHGLLGQSRVPLLRRLQKLFHHGYLERPSCQIDYFHHGGSQPMIYGLSPRAAAYLRRSEALPPGHFVGLADNRSVHRLFLDHALMVSDVLVALEKVCRERGDIRLLLGEQMPESPEMPLHWQVETARHGKIGVVPDAVFRFQITTGSQKQIVCCLEADRGTMPVVSRDPQRSSLARKFAAYETSWREGVFRERFLAARVRVLTVTSSAERLASIQAHLRTDVRSAGIFVQTTLAQALADPRQFLATIIADSLHDT